VSWSHIYAHGFQKNYCIEGDYASGKAVFGLSLCITLGIEIIKFLYKLILKG